MTLSTRHLKDLHLPDKAIDVIDEAGAAKKLEPGSGSGDQGSGIREVTVADIEKIVAKIARVPVQAVSSDDKVALKNLDVELKSVIFGQDAAIDEVASAIKLSRSGLRAPDKPMGNFLFAGPTGVGKTELAKQLARVLKVEFLRFDMSEYMEKHAVSRLIGAPPGYVGYEEGGLLIDAIRKSPHAVLLLDEIEKAHPDLFAILLQVMDHATLTDTHGRHADFRHVILIMTTNAGARDLSGRKMGFFENAQGSKATGVLERVFAPEFRNRLDAIVHFKRARRARDRARRRQAHRRAAAAGGRPEDHDRADAGGADLAGAQGLRSRLRRAADGAADRENDQETAVGFATLRQRQRRRPRPRGCPRGRHQGDTGMKPARSSSVVAAALCSSFRRFRRSRRSCR